MESIVIALEEFPLAHAIPSQKGRIKDPRRIVVIVSSCIAVLVVLTLSVAVWYYFQLQSTPNNTNVTANIPPSVLAASKSLPSDSSVIASESHLFNSSFTHSISSHMAQAPLSPSREAANAGSSSPTNSILTPPPSDEIVTIVVLGASGDLAHKKTYPALFNLHLYNLLPKRTRIIGYARTNMTRETFLEKALGRLPKTEEAEKAKESFRALCDYIPGQYTPDAAADWIRLRLSLQQHEQATTGTERRVRIFYMALPPTVFVDVATALKRHIVANPVQYQVVHRLVVEKPFGRDLASSNALSHSLGALFSEEETYRIDHYLGKEMVKNLMVLRFGNVLFSAGWHRHYIDNVQITFKEPFGTEGRGGYFDAFGIVRDVVQNHLMQLLSIVAMEQPVSLDAEEVRNEKVKVLKCIRPLTLDRLVLGQYGKSLDGKKPSYLDDSTVPAGSTCPTYAALVLFIDNERWQGVPFILKCGKALDEQKAEIRIQFRDAPSTALFGSEHLARNELVLRVQPNEAIYAKLMVKRPGLVGHPTVSELDLSYGTRYRHLRIPDAYESLLYDVLRAEHANFVREDELAAAWAILDAMLAAVDRGEIIPKTYPYGSRGPPEGDALVEKYGYRRTVYYDWTNQQMDKLKL